MRGPGSAAPARPAVPADDGAAPARHERRGRSAPSLGVVGAGAEVSPEEASGPPRTRLRRDCSRSGHVRVPVPPAGRNASVRTDGSAAREPERRTTLRLDVSAWRGDGGSGHKSAARLRSRCISSPLAGPRHRPGRGTRHAARTPVEKTISESAVRSSPRSRSLPFSIMARRYRKCCTGQEDGRNASQPCVWNSWTGTPERSSPYPSGTAPGSSHSWRMRLSPSTNTTCGSNVRASASASMP